MARAARRPTSVTDGNVDSAGVLMFQTVFTGDKTEDHTFVDLVTATAMTGVVLSWRR